MAMTLDHPVLDRYTRSDLRKLRLEGLPLLLIIQYAGAVTFTQLPLESSSVGDRYWVGAASTLLTLGVIIARRLSAWLAGALLVSGLLGYWIAALWLFPSEVVAWLAFLIVGTASTLLGSRIALLTTVLVSLVIAVAGNDGRLSTGVMLSSLMVSWIGACLFWLAARPITITLEWAWGSYADARDKHNQLQHHQGELRRTLKSLEGAYRRLEHLNDELNRARRAAEEARRLKSEFAANISHELRTPLNLILGFSEMMVTMPHTYGARRRLPSYQADIDAIYRNAQHLAGLIDDVLDLSQIETGRVGLTRDRVAVARIVDEAVRAVTGRFKQLGLTLEISVPEDLPLIFVDRTRVRQVLINLLNNAARFTDRGGVRVSAERHDNEIVVSVADTGIGIPPGELPHVFDEFYQTNSALQRRAGGSGLGLAISKRFVELHGGAMWIDSEVDVGSTFSFSLPLLENVTTGTLPGDWEIWDRISHSRPPGTPSLAVLANDETVARAFQRHLEGYRILPIKDASQVSNLTDDLSVRGVVVAAPSPAATWEQLCRVGEDGVTLPVAVCVAPNWGSQAAELGLADYLTKPIFRDQVGRVLDRLGRRVRTILVVDDNADMVRLLARTIRSFGRRYQVWQATGGPEALALMRERRPDAVMLDLLMPKVDGYAVVRAMRADERLRDVPVVAVSAHGATDETPTMGLLGLARPGGFSFDELMRCIRSCFDALQPQREDRSAPAPTTDPTESPASAAARPRQEPSPAPLRAAPSR